NVYYLFASAYGWWKWKWKRNSNNNEDVTKIRRIPTKNIWKSAILFITLFLFITLALKFTDSEVVYSDAFINALSIIGMWMLAHKFIEQWWVWLVVNVVSAGVYFGVGLKPTAIMYAVYAVGSVLGYYNWKKLMKA
ncbi:MAG: nicotinamide riboside transporter PnuC, partial [Tannerella sp.]|nr:nicotinamide riboside transporter PnuC [Tannerella sp.]